MKDLYQILGVSESASEAEVKKAYRKLAKSHHPDVTGGHKEKTERFKEINDAYTVLGDAQKRGEYDRLRHAPVGADGMPQGFDASAFEEIFGGMGGGRGRGGPGGFRVSTFGGGGAGVDPGDLFATLFGGGRGNPFSQRQAGVPRGADMAGRVEISLPEAAVGTTVTIRGGDGNTLEVQVPAGVETGGRLRVPGKGAPAPVPGGKPGDLFLDIVVRPHQHLRRAGLDILLDVPITLKEALLGTHAEVPTVEGPVSVTIPPGTSSGRKLRLRGKGVKKPSGERGDQLCRVEIVVPQLDAMGEKDAETQRLIRELAQHLPDTPVRKF